MSGKGEGSVPELLSHWSLTAPAEKRFKVGRSPD